MVELKDYGQYETAWCPGCGNFPLLKAVKQALVNCGFEPHQVLFVAGIGQAGKAPHYLNANLFNGLHGRTLPVATGAKLANPNLVVIAEGGDGDMYSEGGNHFLSAIRRNVDVTMVVHNNQVYGLTTGQASPTSEEGFVTKTQPMGVAATPFNPIAVAVAMRAGFVARGFAGNTDHLVEILKQAIEHKGFSLVDVLQPCVSFDKVHTFKYYNERCKALPPSYDPENWEEAMSLAYRPGNEIPIGVIYRRKKASFEGTFQVLKAGPLVGRELDRTRLAEIIRTYG
jgi:2-oxoglutarate ferredoxin oxidoreductase subunit beta